MSRGDWRFWKSNSRRDLEIHLLTGEKQGLAESNKVLKDQVTLLQEVFLVENVEWRQIMKESSVEIRDMLSFKTSKSEGKAVEQADNEVLQKIPKLGHKLLAILLIWKKKQTAIEKSKKDKSK
jgi:hypothetical protein